MSLVLQDRGEALGPGLLDQLPVGGVAGLLDANAALALPLAEGARPPLLSQDHLDVLPVDVLQADPAVVLGAVPTAVPTDGFEVQGLLPALVTGGRLGLLLIGRGLHTHTRRITF